MAKTKTKRTTVEAEQPTCERFCEYVEAPFDKTFGLERFGYVRFVTREGPIKWEKMSVGPEAPLTTENIKIVPELCERVTILPTSFKTVMHSSYTMPHGTLYLSPGFMREDPLGKSDKALLIRIGAASWGDGLPGVVLMEIGLRKIDPKTIFTIDADALRAYLIKECSVAKERLPGLRWPEIMREICRHKRELSKGSREEPRQRWSQPMAKIEIMMKLHISSYKVFRVSENAGTYELRPVAGSRQLYQLRLDTLDAETRAKF